MRRHILRASVALLVLTLACGQVTPTAPGPSATAPTAVTPPPAAVGQFTIAIEYAVPGLAAAYAATGVSYAKPQPAFGIWDNIEPEPGRYDWGPTDALVAEYQAAGFTGIQVLITAESPWASARSPVSVTGEIPTPATRRPRNRPGDWGG